VKEVRSNNYDEFGSCQVGWVFHKSELPSDLPDGYRDLRDVIEPYLPNTVEVRGYYGGPGQGFCDSVAIEVGYSKVLVTQRFGYDI
jgi:hypothetical protein